jgi:hypothetical protein
MNTKVTTLVLTAILFCCNSLYSVSRTWTWQGGTSSSWTTKSNWGTTDTDPSIGSDDTVVIENSANSPFLAGNVVAGTLILNSGNIFTNGYDVTVSNDIVLNGSTFFADASLITADNFYLYSGAIGMYGNKFNISDDVVIDGGYLFIIDQNASISDDLFLISGTFDLNGYNLTVGNEYTFEGGSMINTNTISIENFIIDFSGTNTIDYTINILTSMQFINGIIKTSATDLVIFDNNASAIGASAGSHISGPVRRLVALSGNTTFAFPIGNDNVFAPIEISDFDQMRAEDYFTAQYFEASAPYNHGSLAFNLHHISSFEYWMLDRDATSGTPNTDVKVRLTFDEVNRSGRVDIASELRIAKWDGSTWLNLGKADSTGNNTTGSLRTVARVTAFSPFTLASATSGNPLPVKLLNFHAVGMDKSVKVLWSTTSEVNNDYFTVEKSIDGMSWTAIGRVEGAENSGVLSNYAFTDMNPVAGVQYYRLLQTDLNGAGYYSHVATVNYKGGVLPSSVAVFPNPAGNVVTLSLGETATDAAISVYNSMGVKVMELGGQSGLSFTLDMSGLERGVYTIEITQESGISYSKVLKN